MPAGTAWPCWFLPSHTKEYLPAGRVARETVCCSVASSLVKRYQVERLLTQRLLPHSATVAMCSPLVFSTQTATYGRSRPLTVYCREKPTSKPLVQPLPAWASEIV